MPEWTRQETEGRPYMPLSPYMHTTAWRSCQYGMEGLIRHTILQVNVSRGASSAEDGDADSLAAATGVAKGRVVSAMMRKHLVEGMVPVMAELKRMLEARRHPLLANMMLALRVLLKDHKSEVS